MTEKTFPQLCCVILMNEIEPRNKKYKKIIDPEVTGFLAKLEFNKLITRKQLREELDILYGNS